MVEMRKVLIIEDRKDIGNQVMLDFKTAGIEVDHFQDIEQLQDNLTHLNEYQMVILDWILDGTSSASAKVCLSLIRNTLFIPIVVWTEEIEVFEGESDEVYKLFPQAYIKSCSKSTVVLTDLMGYLKDWYSQPPMSFTQQFRNSINNAVESALYNLAHHSLNDLISGLQSLIIIGQNDSLVDIEHAVDVLIRLVSRDVYQDLDFISELKEIIENFQGDDKNPIGDYVDIKPSIQDLHMYYKPRDQIVRTGDLVQIKYEEMIQKAIVITPACDLAQPQKTYYLRLVMVRLAANAKEREGNKIDQKVLPEGGNKKVVYHHEIIVLLDETLFNDKTIKSVMVYDHSYKTITGQDVTLQRIKRLDDPYRSDLLHHFVSHAGRIGTPDF